MNIQKLINRWKLTIIIILFLILFPLGLFGLKGVDTKMVPPTALNSTPQPSRTTDNAQSPTETTYPTNSQINDPENRLIDKVANRRPLSSQDAKALDALMTSLSTFNHTGVIYQTALFNIEYIQAPDLFKV